MKVVILSFTQAGTRLGERIGSQFRNEGITCQNYAPAGYAFADILPFPDNPKELIREGLGRDILPFYWCSWNRSEIYCALCKG